MHPLSTSWISHGRQCSCTAQRGGCNGLVQVIYIVQPSSLTQSLLFVCLSLFHLIHIKTLFHTNWKFQSCQCNANASWHINALRTLSRKGEKYDCEGLSCHKMPNHRNSSDTVYIKVLFGFILFLYHVFDSLELRQRLSSLFPLRVSSTDKHGDLVTFFRSF